jgi:ornithine decarboxylase
MQTNLKPSQILELVNQNGSPLQLFSQAVFVENYKLLQANLPMVKLHFAIKSLPYLPALKAINQIGGYYDVATSGEIELLKQGNLSPETSSDKNKFIHTHPIKTLREIQIALDFGIQVFVVDNLEELKKFESFKLEGREFKLMLRIAFSNKEVSCDLSYKFGIELDEMPKILTILSYAKLKNINICGLCFHIGSGLSHSDLFVASLKKIAKLYKEIKNNELADFKVLDIGGGFPCSNQKDFSIESYCKPICEYLTKEFKDYEIWAEPGRFISASSCISIASIVGKTTKNHNGQSVNWYYLDDGLYNSLAGLIYDHGKFEVTFVKQNSKNGNKDEVNFLSILAGPTCDSIDVFGQGLMLPNLEIGDFTTSATTY